jgi:hypothetical protein
VVSSKMMVGTGEDCRPGACVAELVAEESCTGVIGAESGGAGCDAMKKE